MIQVRYFAAIREAIGSEQEAIAPEGIEKVADLLERLRSWDERRASVLAPERRVLVAVNQEYADLQKALSDGDEVAFFPPVTGGLS